MLIFRTDNLLIDAALPDFAAQVVVIAVHWRTHLNRKAPCIEKKEAMVFDLQESNTLIQAQRILLSVSGLRNSLKLGMLSSACALKKENPRCFRTLGRRTVFTACSFDASLW